MTMKRKIILRLSFLIALLVILWSCRNEDFVQAEKNPQRNNRDFFKHSKSGGINAKSGIDYVAILEAYNREKNFLSTMPDQQGMPIWNKMQVVDTDNATGLMIPLSHDNETMSSVLFATLDQENSVTGVIDHDNKLLEDIVYNENVDHELRERLFYTFMYMDNKTFGTEQFTGIPKDLFSGKKYDTNYGRIWLKDLAAGHQAQGSTSKMLFIESCGSYWSCKNHESWKNCDHCAACYSTSCSTIMIYIPDEGFPGTTGSPGDGGGGGGTPEPQPPKDPCSLNTVFYRLAPGCGGGNTDIPDLNHPCAKVKSIVNNPKLKPKIDSLKQYSLTAVANEKGYQQDKAGNVTPATVNGAHHVDFIIGTNSLGGIHCHTLNGTHMFSPKDILTLLSFAGVQNQTLPIGSTVDNTGNAYLGMIAQSGSYFITFNGGSGDLPPPMTDAEEDAFELEMNETYKKNVKKLLKAEGKNISDDLSDIGLQKLFFSIIKEMGLEGKINLIKENNGNTSTIQQNPDGTIKAPLPC